MTSRSALLPIAAGLAAMLSASAAAEPNRPALEVVRAPMLFYLANGVADACGPGCSQWIAAEGYFDPGAARRLWVFLGRLQGQGRQLPIFFHSQGGIQTQATEIGRLLRQREMTAGVSQTVPDGCAGLADAECRALKRSGQSLAAQLRTLGGCYSACVFALVGAKVRKVPPGARLGVHATRLVLVRSDGRVLTPGTDTSARAGPHKAMMEEQLTRYFGEMGIDGRLLEIAAKIPHEKILRLTRDQIAEFGIDRSEFQETRWAAAELPRQPPAAYKFLVEARGAGGREYRVSVLQLACSGARRIRIAYARGLGSDEAGTGRLFKLSIGDRNFLFARRSSVSKIDAFDHGGTFETRVAVQPIDFFAGVQAGDSIEISQTDLRGAAAQSAPATRLSAVGLAEAVEALRGKCADAI